MGIDNKEDIKRIKSKISAFKTLRKQKQEAKKRKKKSFSEKVDKAKKLSSETLTNLKNSAKKKTDSLFEDLIELFIQTNESVDETIKEQKEKFNKEKKNKSKKKKSGKLKNLTGKYSAQTQNIVNTVKNSNSFKQLGSIFFVTVENTKAKISQLLIEDIIFTIGCSEEQSYSNISNTSTPLYINLKTIDLFKILKNSPDDKYGKLNYESTETQNGVIPYSMNRELYKRLSSPQSFSQEYHLSY
jgi:hypothetical protein